MTERAPIRVSEEDMPWFPYDDIPLDPAVIIEMFLDLSDPAKYVQDDPALIAGKRDLLGLLEMFDTRPGNKVTLFHREPRLEDAAPVLQGLAPG